MYKELKIRRIIIAAMIIALAAIIGVIAAGILTSTTGLFEPKEEYIEVEAREISRTEVVVDDTTSDTAVANTNYIVTYEVYYNNKTYTKVITYDTEESIPDEIKAYINKYNTDDIIIKATGLGLDF